MDITKHNFNEKLDFILESIANCAFMAVDGEFTGLSAYDGGSAAPFDTPEERYSKIQMGSTDFLLIQYGLCTYHIDADTERYEARPFNFYVFPRPHNRQAQDKRFLCQSSSIDFLVSQGFDFNKLFREGIPYLVPEEEVYLQKALEQKHNDASKLMSAGAATPDTNKGKMTIPEEQKPFLDGIYDKVGKYLDSEEPEPLSLPPCNAFQRRLIYQTVEEKFPSVHLETVTGEKKERYMLVSRTKNTEDKIKKEQQKQAIEKLELDVQVGFSKVIKAITKSEKLVVGHNMLLDVIHSVNQFHCNIPEDLSDFKTVVKTVFPRLLDTKLMASTSPFKEYFLATSLDEVRLTLLHKPFLPVEIDLPEGFEKYKDGGGSLHEAGYDAFITGSCFAHMVKFLGTFQNPREQFLLPTAPLVEPFVNKLYLMRINDIPYLNLNGPDLPPQRDHVFHVSFPKEWKPTDLYTLFQPYGNIQISWLTETSAYVALHKKDNANMALEALSKETGSFHVVSYSAHRNRRSYKWSASDTEPPKLTQKRKCDDDDFHKPPKKIERNSHSHDLHKPVQKISLSAKQNKEMKEHNPSISSEKNSLHDNLTTDLLSKSEGSSLENKLFEESDVW